MQHGVADLGVRLVEMGMLTHAAASPFTAAAEKALMVSRSHCERGITEQYLQLSRKIRPLGARPLLA